MLLGRLHRKRAIIRVQKTVREMAKRSWGNVPLSEMFGYTTDLRSATQGRGVFSQEFDHYAPVPEAIANKVMG